MAPPYQQWQPVMAKLQAECPNMQLHTVFFGTPDDDGYISSAVGQEMVEDQLNPQSFVDMYMVKVNNPSNYSMPRRIMLGLSMNF